MVIDILPLLALCFNNRYFKNTLFQFAAELGEYDPKEHTQGYVSEFRFIPNQVGPNVIMMILFCSNNNNNNNN